MFLGVSVAVACSLALVCWTWLVFRVLPNETGRHSRGGSRAQERYDDRTIEVFHEINTAKHPYISPSSFHLKHPLEVQATASRLNWLAWGLQTLVLRAGRYDWRRDPFFARYSYRPWVITND